MITNEYKHIHANITNDLNRPLTNDKDFLFVSMHMITLGGFLSMCEEALIFLKMAISLF